MEKGPKFIEQPSSVVVVSRTPKAVLECRATCNPACKYKWFRGLNLDEEVRLMMHCLIDLNSHRRQYNPKWYFMFSIQVRSLLGGAFVTVEKKYFIVIFKFWYLQHLSNSVHKILDNSSFRFHKILIQDTHWQMGNWPYRILTKIMMLLTISVMFLIRWESFSVILCS